MVGQAEPRLVPLVLYVDPLLRLTTVPHSSALLVTALHRRTQQPVSAVGVHTIAAPDLGSWQTLPSQRL
jgi:hypothetical protein